MLVGLFPFKYPLYDTTGTFRFDVEVGTPSCRWGYVLGLFGSCSHRNQYRNQTRDERTENKTVGGWTTYI